MKKSFTLIISILMLSMQNIFAQNPPQDAPVMTINVAKGSEIIISLSAAYDNTDVWIETSTGNYSYMTLGLGMLRDIHIVAETDVVNIYGNIKEIDCSSNSYKISGLDLSKDPFMRTLNCSDNQIINLNVNDEIISIFAMRNKLCKLDVSHCQSLLVLYCDNNSLHEIDIRNTNELQHLSINENPVSAIKMNEQNNLYSMSFYGCELEACQLDTIFYKVPDRFGDITGIFYLKNVGLTNPGADGCKTDVAYGKYWRVLDYNNGYYLNVYGDGTGCAAQSVEQFNELTFNVMPNPVYSEITIEIPNFSGSENFAVYDVTGKIVFEQIITESHATISLSSLNKGVYIVKIGTFVQKIVKM